MVPLTAGGSQTSPPVKVKKTDLVDSYVAAINRRPSASRWPQFPLRLYKMVDSERNVRIVEETAPDTEPGVLRTVSERGVKLEIINYSRATGAALLAHDAQEVLTAWLAQAPSLDENMVFPVLELSEPGYCWRRLPFDLAEGPSPTFDEIMSRTSNSEALMAWLGGLLVESSDRQQYVWLYGTGRNGKSSLARFFYEVFGPSYRTEYVPAKHDRFWTSGLVGARLVVFPDCNEFWFPTEGRFKSLTGDDAVRVERKMEASFTTRLAAKFMFLSNEQPEISGSTADMRRAIYCALGALPSEVELLPSGEYQARLWAEGAAWLWKCRETWRRVTAGGSRVITADMAQVQAVAAVGNELFETTFDERFVRADFDRSTQPAGWPYILPLQLQRLYRELKWDTGRIRRWQKWLAAERGVTCEVMWIPERNRTERRWVGLRWNSDYVSQMMDLP